MNLLADASAASLTQLALWLVTALLAVLVVFVARISSLRFAEARREREIRERNVEAPLGATLGITFDAEDIPTLTPALAESLDIDATPLRGLGVLDARVHPKDRSSWDRARDARQAQRAETLEFQCRMRAADQSWRWLHVVQRRVADKGATRYVSTVLDFTERRELEDRAARSAEILRTSASVLTILSGNGDRGPALRLAIEVVARTLRTERASFCAVEPDADRASFEFEWIDPFAADVTSVLAQRQLLPPHAVVWWLDAFGTGRPVVVQRDAVTLADPVKAARIHPDAQAMLVVPVVALRRVRGAITFEHIQARRPFTTQELALAQTLAFASARVIERGLAAERDARIEFMERRLGRTELLARLADSVGPDLRDALFALTGAIESLPRDAKRGLDAVRDIVLALGETNGDDSADPSDIPLANEIASAIGLARRLLPASFTIETEADSSDAMIVRASHATIRRLIISLLTAARESAGRDGRVRVGARIERDERFGVRAAISVEDDGPPRVSVRPKVLDVFGAVDAPTVELLEAIARRAAMDCGGTIEISTSSSLGGRRAVARFQLAGDEKPTVTRHESPERLHDIGRVLIIDDDAAVRAVLTEAFAALDVEVESRDNASGAERIVLDGVLRFDLVVIDIDLPGGAGTACLDRLRRGGSLVPALVLTDGRSDIHSALAPLRVLRKPFGLEALLREARAVVDDARAWTRP